MEIIAPWGTVKLAPVMEFYGVHNRLSTELFGLWALPGGRQMYTSQIRDLCRENRWVLIETEFLKAREAITGEWEESLFVQIPRL